jgi:hypothetical protein
MTQTKTTSENSYKRKFESLRQTVQRWATLTDPHEISNRVRAYDKRRKAENQEYSFAEQREINDEWS